MRNRYIVGHCQECDSEVLYLKNVGNIQYADTKCHNCGGYIFIDPNDEVLIDDSYYYA